MRTVAILTGPETHFDHLDVLSALKERPPQGKILRVLQMTQY